MTAKFSQCAVKENKGHQHPNPSQAHEQIIERNRFTWFLKLSMKYSLLFSNINVSKQSQQNTKKVVKSRNIQALVNILTCQKSKAQSSV